MLRVTSVGSSAAAVDLVGLDWPSFNASETVHASSLEESRCGHAGSPVMVTIEAFGHLAIYDEGCWISSDANLERHLNAQRRL